MYPQEVIEDDRPAVVSKIQEYTHRVDRLQNQVKDLQISSGDRYRVAIALDSAAKKLAEEIDADRKKGIEPYRRIVNMANDAAKLLTSRLDSIKASTKALITSYLQQLEKHSEQAKNEGKAVSEALGIDIDIYVPDAPTTLSSADGTVSSKIKMSFSVIEESLIPREYLMVDEKKVQTAIKIGIKNIPGIKIVEEKQIMIRRK